HSARDTFQMLYDKNVYIEAKPFSIGFRIEHEQSMIDEARFGPNAGNEILGAADYKLVHHCKNGRSVYSFCMCPGGTVIGASSEKGAVVTNGMSQYTRENANANSAIVAEVFPGDLGENPMDGFLFQRHWEQKAFQMGGENFNAPVQLVGDFLSGTQNIKISSVVPSYLPGYTLSNLKESLPPAIIKTILEALPVFNNKIPGFTQPDAILTGVESRTSSPLRILRGTDFQSISLRGIFPIGEGSGYAGGIMSSSIDGIKAAEHIIKIINEEK
ncbi:MAG: FAD-binding protein, partial [Cyclobacteriaceae bacterium]|nr:FAD-binding protein [Cyclobacteriaceae bacterium]